MAKLNITIVDDEADNRLLLEKFLKETYQTFSYDSGEACLQGIAQHETDIFLLDVRMPGGMDGFELCRTLRSADQHATTPILFLSAMDSLDDKLQGYAAGAEDYITKPLELAELQRKLDAISERLQRFRQQQAQSANAFDVAMTAMTNSGEIGEVLQFYEALNEQESYQSLANHTVNVLRKFGLNCVVQLRLQHSQVIASTSESYNELEEKLMSQGRNLDRIYSFGNRCLFTFTNSSILVRKMPEEADKAGRIRDHFASILNGVEARISSLQTEEALARKNEGLIIKALTITESALSDILTQFKRHETDVSSIIDAMRQSMDLAFSYLDLNEEQEEYLMQIFDQSKQEIDQLFASGQKIDAQFESVIETLRTLLAQSSR